MVTKNVLNISKVLLNFSTENVQILTKNQLKQVRCLSSFTKENKHLLDTNNNNLVLRRNGLLQRYYSTTKDTQIKQETTDTSDLKIKVDKLKEEPKVKLTAAQKLKKAVAEYGSTVIVFHIGISLISLGTSYILVSNGLDVSSIMEKIGMDAEGLNGKFASNAGTFVTAYAIHKVFAPVRISITLGATPFIVRYLRAKGILKK